MSFTIYKVHRRRELRPGYRRGSAPTGGIDWTIGYQASRSAYYSSGGGEVSEEESTCEVIEMVRTSSENCSDADHERAVTELCEMLKYDPSLGHGPDEYDSCLAEKAAKALDKMAVDNPSLRYQIGLEGLKSPWKCVTIWGIRQIGVSGHKRAVGALRRIIEANSSGKDFYGFAQAAREALKQLGDGGSFPGQ